jgi:hypothetical protein
MAVGTSDVFTWTPTLPGSNTYQIFAKWPSGQPLAKDAVFTFSDSTGTNTATATVDQSLGGGSGNTSSTRTSTSPRRPR